MDCPGRCWREWMFVSAGDLLVEFVSETRRRLNGMYCNHCAESECVHCQETPKEAPAAFVRRVVRGDLQRLITPPPALFETTVPFAYPVTKDFRCGKVLSLTPPVRLTSRVVFELNAVCFTDEAICSQLVFILCNQCRVEFFLQTDAFRELTKLLLGKVRGAVDASASFVSGCESGDFMHCSRKLR